MRNGLCILLGLVALILVDSAEAANNPKGRWKVFTTLVQAQDAINQDYKPGDKRLEYWTITRSGKTAELISHAGTIQGTKFGKAWVFDQSYDGGLGIVTHIHLVARVIRKKIKGTIEARYYSAQFGYELGVDSWTFRGKKQRKKRRKK